MPARNPSCGKSPLEILKICQMGLGEGNPWDEGHESHMFSYVFMCLRRVECTKRLQILGRILQNTSEFPLF